MFTNKKSVFIVLLCFLITLFSFPHLRAQEKVTPTPSKKQKEDSKQKYAPTVAIKGAKLTIAPGEKASEKQEVKNQQEQVPAQGHPKISFDSSRYDAGEVWEGDQVIHTFIVKNTGTAQLDITKVKPG